MGLFYPDFWRNLFAGDSLYRKFSGMDKFRRRSHTPQNLQRPPMLLERPGCHGFVAEGVCGLQHSHKSVCACFYSLFHNINILADNTQGNNANFHKASKNRCFCVLKSWAGAQNLWEFPLYMHAGLRYHILRKSGCMSLCFKLKNAKIV